jgi:ADP-ribose pyrophosphatase YjhB (NUDIX family)
MSDKKPDFQIKVPEQDDRERRVCGTCGFIDYVNPKIVAGVVAEDAQGRVLMCKRAIEPRSGFWTLPAGYMEEGESVAEGAAREAYEEARAKLEIVDLLGVYSIPRISQVQIFFRARLTSRQVSAGPESEAVALYAWEDIPFNDLAFPSVRWALEDWRVRRDGPAPSVPSLRTQGKDFAPY